MSIHSSASGQPCAGNLEVEAANRHEPVSIDICLREGLEQVAPFIVASAFCSVKFTITASGLRI